MAISTQLKMLRAAKEILLGNGQHAFPSSTEPKPNFNPNHSGTSIPLPRSTPEEQGMESSLLTHFFQQIATTPDINAHSLLVARNGTVIGEGSFAPYQKDIWHVVHSFSKTITGTAVGIAIEENLFELDDLIVNFFPEQVGFFTPKYMRSITIRHLLTMSSGISYNEISETVDSNWIKGIFSSPVSFEPGTQFLYNSMNSYLLAAILSKTSGESLVEYLTPRLFQPMGFGQIAWEKSPDGIEKGGWGLYLTIEDMAKMGQLYLQKGNWNVEGTPRQLVPESWINQATSLQITGGKGEGYGFHLWVDDEEGHYIMNGMMGQYVTVVPQSGIVLAMTAGTPHMFTNSPAYHLMRKHFYHLPSLPNFLPPNPKDYGSLQHLLGSLRFRQPLPPPVPPLKRLPGGKLRPVGWGAKQYHPAPLTQQKLRPFYQTRWDFPQNKAGLLPVLVQAMNNNFSAGILSLELKPEQDHLLLVWEEGGNSLQLPVGLTSPIQSTQTIGKETFLVASSLEIKSNEMEETVLLIQVCFLELSSFRLIKLTHRKNTLLLQLDEQPQFNLAIESMLDRGESLASSLGAKSKTNSLSELVFGNEYIHFQVSQLFNPELTGTPAITGADKDQYL